MDVEKKKVRMSDDGHVHLIGPSGSGSDVIHERL